MNRFSDIYDCGWNAALRQARTLVGSWAVDGRRKMQAELTELMVPTVTSSAHDRIDRATVGRPGGDPGDEMIDLSDIPEATEEWFRRARCILPGDVELASWTADSFFWWSPKGRGPAYVVRTMPAPADPGEVELASWTRSLFWNEQKGSTKKPYLTQEPSETFWTYLTPPRYASGGLVPADCSFWHAGPFERPDPGEAELASWTRGPNWMNHRFHRFHPYVYTLHQRITARGDGEIIWHRERYQK